MKNYNVGIVGLGVFGMEHLKVLSKTKNVNIIAVCDLDNEKLDNVKNNYSVKYLYNNYQELVSNNEIDAVHITTNEESHYEIALAAIEHNKNLYIEKPLTTNVKEAYEIREFANKKNIKISTGHLLRYDNRHRHIYDSIQKGEIGKIKGITLRRNFKKSMLDHYGRMNAFLNAMIHDIDLIQFFTNEKITVESSNQYYKHLNSNFMNFAVLKTTSGIPCSLENIWLLPDEYPFGMEFEVNVYGEYGLLRTRTTPHVEHYSRYSLYPDLSLDEALERKIRASISYFKGESNDNSPTLDEAIHNIEVAEGLKGRIPV